MSTSAWQPIDSRPVVVNGPAEHKPPVDEAWRIVEHSKRVSGEARAREAARADGYRDGYAAGLRAASDSRARTAQQPERDPSRTPVVAILPDRSVTEIP